MSRLWRRITGRWQLERLAALEAKVGKFGRAQREDAGGAAARSSTASARSSPARPTQRAVRAAGAAAVERSAGLAGAAGSRVSPSALERARLLDEQGVDDRRFARRIEQLLRARSPDHRRPWTGEVGFELLYWVPFVRWVVRTYGLPLDGWCGVARRRPRPGTAAWRARYADMFSLLSRPKSSAPATEEAKKQRLRRRLRRRRGRARASARIGLERPELLHPGHDVPAVHAVLEGHGDRGARRRVHAPTTRLGGAERSRVEDACQTTTSPRGSISATAFPIRPPTARSSRRRSRRSAGRCRSCCSTRRLPSTTTATRDRGSGQRARSRGRA